MGNIETDRDGRVFQIRLNNPETLNSLTPELLRDLIKVCGELSEDEMSRIVVLEGTGANFSSGADLPAFNKGLASTPHETADVGRLAVEALADLPQITLAKIRGHCVGGAVVLAAACDLRIAAGDARFWIPELDAGIPLAWGGWAHLVRLVGETMATDMVLGAEPFDAEAAQQARFVSRVIGAGDLDTETAALVAAIARKPDLPLRRTKRQLLSIRSGTFDASTDADGLLAAFNDPEAGQVLRSYADRLG